MQADYVNGLAEETIKQIVTAKGQLIERILSSSFEVRPPDAPGYFPRASSAKSRAISCSCARLARRLLTRARNGTIYVLRSGLAHRVPAKRKNGEEFNSYQGLTFTISGAARSGT